MIYFLSHLTSFAQNFLIKGMIFAVFFGIAIGLIVFLVSRHELTASTDDVGRSIAYGLLAMAVIMVMIFAFTMAAQEVGIKKALFKKLDTNYPGYTDVKYSQSDDTYTFKCKDQWYSCDFDYYNGEKLTVYKIDKEIDKTIE